MGKYTRKKLFLDESRIWNKETSIMKHDRVRSYLLPYFWYDVNTEYLVGIKIISEDLTKLTIQEKKIGTLEK